MRTMVGKIYVAVGIVAAGIVVLLWVWPVQTATPRPVGDPPLTYEQSCLMMDALLARDQHPDVADDCRSIVLTHGRQTERAVVMYHGYTNCPRQYEILARMFFDRGYNVYVPRFPYHGLKDRISPDLRRLTLDDLLDVSARSVDIARGLGREVTVLGLSLGGVLSAWNAQFRPDVSVAVVIAPSLGWYYLPGMIKPLLTAAYLFPDRLMWWHPVSKEQRPIPYSMYHKFSTRGMGHALMLSLSLLRVSRDTPPLARRIIVMTTDRDRAVDGRTTLRLADRWQRQGARVDHYRFPAALGLEHDLIDPLQPYQQTGLVYEMIFNLLDANQ